MVPHQNICLYPLLGPSAFLEPLPSLSATLLETYLSLPNSSSNHSLLFSADELSFYLMHLMGRTPDSCTPTIRFTQRYRFHPPWRKQKTDFHLSSDFRFPASSEPTNRTSASCFCVSNMSFQLVFLVSFKYLF